MSDHEPEWHDLGVVDDLKNTPLQQITIGRTRIALSYRDGQFGAISDVCNHVAGPLGQGTLEGDYCVCPWHHYRFHRITGEGEPGYEDDKVPGYTLREQGGRLYVDLKSATQRHKLQHTYPLARTPQREPGRVRLLGISTTVMDDRYPRYSTSDTLLQTALDHAATLDADTQLIRLNALNFRHCEGYYSKSAHACTWPCSITQMDKSDEMKEVYEAIVHWCDAVIVATPIRWGAASSLYFKMIERMNCIQNQITIANNVLIRNKTAAFIITGGQDNIQAVAGQMMMFYGELGFEFPQFPFIAHSRGWSAEDMERNVAFVKNSRELRDGAQALAVRTLEKARSLVDAIPVTRTQRAGRKAHSMAHDEPQG